MVPMDLVAWTAKLVATAAVLGGYPLPDAPPPVSVMDPAVLARQFCGGPCAIRGAYVHGQGVMIAAGLDIDGSPMDRSVLLHELVHYLQDINGRFRDDSPCDRWKEREIEAYALQDSYLSRYNMGLGAAMDAALQVLPAGCASPPDPARAPAIYLFRDGQP